MKDKIFVVLIIISALLITASLDQFLLPVYRLMMFLKPIIAFPFASEGHAIMVTAIFTAIGIYWRTTYQQKLMRKAVRAYALGLRSALSAVSCVLTNIDGSDARSVRSSLLALFESFEAFERSFLTKDVLMLCTEEQISISLSLSSALKLTDLIIKNNINKLVGYSFESCDESTALQDLYIIRDEHVERINVVMELLDELIEEKI